MLFPDGYNATDRFIDRHIREMRGSKIAIVCGDQTMTYQKLASRTNQAGNLFRACGVRTGDRVLILAPDIPDFGVCFFAAMKIAAIPVPINPNLSTEEIAYIIDDSEATLMVIHPYYVQKIKHTIKKIVLDDTFEQLVEKNSDELNSVPIGEHDPGLWLYTSGSTGAPKACVHGQYDMDLCSEHFARGILGIREDDRIFSVSKLFFAYGLGNALYYPLAFRAMSILMPEPPKIENILKVLETHRPTVFFSVPSNYAALLAHIEATNSDKNIFRSVRIAISAGEPLPASLFQKFKERFGLEILDGIGSTEALQAFISNRPGDICPGSSGKPLPGYEAKILNDDGEPIKQGKPGNLWIKTPAMLQQYWNQPEKTAAAIRDQWLCTGDIYQEDENGYFWFIGRADDMFKSNGKWVSPIEIECILLTHPAVSEAAVVGQKNSEGLFRPLAFIVLRSGFDGSADLALAIASFAKNHLPAFKQPTEIRFLEEIPKTATGKIQRFKLRTVEATAQPRPAN